MFDISKARDNYNKTHIEPSFDEVLKSTEFKIDEMIEENSNKGINQVCLERRFFEEIVICSIKGWFPSKYIEDFALELKRHIKDLYTNAGYNVIEVKIDKDCGYTWGGETIISWENK